MNINQNACFRVIFESREIYRLTDEKQNIYQAELSGAFRHSSPIWPTVGDWVFGRAQKGEESDWILIEAVAERKNVFQRETAEALRPQVLAANLDLLFVVTSANHDLNLNRLDRYLALAASSNIKAVVLVNKIELSEEPGLLLDEIAQRYPQTDVHGVSAVEKWNLQSALESYLAPGMTIAFVGSSGVGKSSLTNSLLPSDEMKTQEVRESDSRGRHTTTHRELLMTESGVAIIDTPGIRSVGLTDNTELDSIFSDVENLVQNCRFSDCRHESEPGCAVNEALASNTLEESRWSSYLKLQKEVAYEKRKTDKALMSQEKKKWAKISRSINLKKRGR